MHQANRVLAAVAAVAFAALGCSAGPAEESQQDAESVAQEVGRTVADTGEAIKTLSAPVASALRDLADGSGGVRARMERAMADSVVSAGCVSLSWASWSATVSFDECQLADTGKLLDGAVSVTVRPLRRTVAVAFDDLTLGDHGIYGTMSVRLDGLVGALTFHVDADLTLDDTAATLVADDLGVRIDLDGMTVWGAGAVITPKVDATATFDDLHWNMLDCLPSSGYLSFEADVGTGTITFLPTTPETGKVRLQIGRLPAVTVAMFPACPTL